VAVTGPKANFFRCHYDNNGNRLLEQDGSDQRDLRGNTVKTSYALNDDRWKNRVESTGVEETHYDAKGEPERIGQRKFVWDALGKLLEVRDGKRIVARYRYNHRGERIDKAVGGKHTYYLYEDRRLVAELDSEGRLWRQYVYLADQPVAIIDCLNGASKGTADLESARLIANLAHLWRSWFGTGEAFTYLHNNHLGAVEMATNAKGKPIWHAVYRPFGKLMSALAHGTSRFELNLRLPGQYNDEETGLYYNDHRYYDPVLGRYLTPDPLGLGGGSNGYIYADANPMKYIDPDGLILFAFDGTANSENPAAGDSISNVEKFLLAYDKAQNGPKFYITGIGTTNKDMSYEGSIYSGDGFNQRVALGFSFLDNFIRDDTNSGVLNIDVVGFSRGAAEARVWINQLVSKIKDGTYYVDKKSRCINLRFEGLWDTVSHLGKIISDDKNYDFGIPSQVKYAVQAVALNEHRGGTTNFDGRSIFNAPSTTNTTNRIELGFVGSHADIGGGYGTGDLSDVTLMWIIQQAKSQGIKFNETTISNNGWDKVTKPILHDKSHNNTQRLGDPPSADERQFIYGNGKKVNQADAIIGGHNTAWARGFVSYYRTACGKGGNVAVGQVDMASYSAWLLTQGISMNHSSLSPTPLCN
jgi:RHS repeat-associated protein